MKDVRYDEIDDKTVAMISSKIRKIKKKTNWNHVTNAIRSWTALFVSNFVKKRVWSTASDSFCWKRDDKRKSSKIMLQNGPKEDRGILGTEDYVQERVTGSEQDIES